MAARPLDKANVEKKLRNISNTQESIQSLSLWIIFHKAHHEQLVEMWFKALQKAKIEHRLVLLYLCNDIVQTCKRKHAIVFKDAYKEVLKDAALFVRDTTIRPKAERIFKIWKERNIYDAEFIDQLISILNNTEIRTTGNSKLLAEFKPQQLAEEIVKFKKLASEVELKRRHLVVLSLDASNIDNVHLLKDRAHGKEYSQQFEDACQKLEDYVKHLSKEIHDKTTLIQSLEQSELFYDAQYGEAKIVTNAYKNFGNRVHNLRRRLLDHRQALPTPGPSPPLQTDAPSPGATPPQPRAECSGGDNSDMVDMDLSDEGDANEAGKDDSAKMAAAAVAVVSSPKSVDSAPSPEGSPVDLNFSPPRQDDDPDAGDDSALTSLYQRRLEIQSQLSAADDDGADDSLQAIANLLPSFAKGAQASFMSVAPAAPSAPQHDPRGKRDWIPALAEPGTGDGTPVKDEGGRSTPVLDEAVVAPPGGGAAAAQDDVANPIEFLTKLISQSQPAAGGGAAGGASSFLGGLTGLADTVKSPYQQADDDVVTEGTASEEKKNGVTDDDSDGDTPASSWAAWKAQQEPPDKEPPDKEPPPLPSPPQPPLYATFPMATYAPFPQLDRPPVPRPPLPPLQPTGQWGNNSFNPPSRMLGPPRPPQPPRAPPLGLHLAPPICPPALSEPSPPLQGGPGWGGGGGPMYAPRPPLEPPCPQPPVSPPSVLVGGRGGAGVEEEQNEFIRKLKRKTSMSSSSSSPTSPTRGVPPLLTGAPPPRPAPASNLRTLMEVTPDPAPPDGMRPVNIQSVVQRPFAPDSQAAAHRGNHDGYHDAAFDTAFEPRYRDGYDRLPPKRPAPPYDRSGYYQRY